MITIWRWLRRIAAIGLAGTATLLLATSVFQSGGKEVHFSVVIVVWILSGAALVAAWVIWPKRRLVEEPAPESDRSALKEQANDMIEIGGVAVDAAALVSLTDELALVVDDGVIDAEEQEDIDALVAELGLRKAERDAVLAAIIGGMIEDAAADGEIDKEEELWIRAALVALRIELTGPLIDLFEIACVTREDAAAAAKQLQKERRNLRKPRREKASSALFIRPKEEHSSIEFTYENAKGEIKYRVVDVIKIKTDKEGRIDVGGFDDIAGGYRTFKLARMSEIMDTATGEIYDTPRVWAHTAAKAAKAPAGLLRAIDQ